MKADFQTLAGAALCKKCGTPSGQLSTDPDDALLRCPQCKLLFEEHLGDILEVNVEYAEAGGPGKETIYLPFWQFIPRVKIFKRAIKKASFLDAPTDALKNRFYSPGFGFKDILSVSNLCAFLSMNNPRYKTGEPHGFITCKYTHWESQRIARGIFLLIEAQEKDKIFGMDYELLFDQPRLVILPFEDAGERLTSPILNLTVPKKAIF